MISNRTLLVTALTLAVWIAPAAQAAAQSLPPGPPPGGFGPPPTPPPLPLFEARLTAVQQDQVRAAMDAQRQVTEPLEAELREADRQLRMLVLADAPDVQAIGAASEHVDQIHQQMFHLQVELCQQLAALLTPAQRARLRALPDPPEAGERRPNRAPTSRK